MDSKLSEAQKRASKKWDDNNKERLKYLKLRSNCKSFIKNKATKEDLQKILQLINDRL